MKIAVTGDWRYALINMNQPPHQSTPSVAPIRVFLVEDSSAVRDLIVENLSDIPNLEFAGFSDTESDALEQLNKQGFDVVILDIELRLGNGISLLRSLAALPPTKNLKIIFSNNVSSAYRRVGNEYGVRHFFDKTSELPKLRALLQEFSANSWNDRAV